MKKFLSILAVIGLLMACGKEKNPSGGNGSGNNDNEQTVELTGLSLNQHEVSVEKGGNTVLSVTFTPADATNKQLTWVSSDTSIATVTDGIVVGVSVGSTDIVVKSGEFTDKCIVSVVVSATAISLDQTELTLNKGVSATIVATVTPSDATDGVIWSTSDESVATVDGGTVTAVAAGTATITASAGTVKAECVVSVTNAPVGAVDLGLSVYWATCNIGASSPEEYGDYYAWGETEPKSNYSWATYKWCNGSDNSFTKYNTDSSCGTVDNKQVLDPEDDVAHVKLGGSWRMPTDAEIDELMNTSNCTWEMTTQNGVKGYKVTSMKTGYTNNWIFLPAAGYRDGTSLNDAGSYGLYWSSSLYTDIPLGAYYLFFYSSYVYGDNNFRSFGLSVRPVSE